MSGILLRALRNRGKVIIFLLKGRLIFLGDERVQWGSMMRQVGQDELWRILSLAELSVLEEKVGGSHC